MPQCFVSNCSNYYGKTRGKVKVMYHIFPTKPELVAKWSVLCGYKKDFKAPPYARVCSEHFGPNSYQRDLQHELLGLPLRKKLKADAVPNRNLPIQSSQKNVKDCQLSKKRIDNTIKSSFSIISGNKTKQSKLTELIPNKKSKTQLENISNGNSTKPKAKSKSGLSKSHSLIRISISDLCRNKSSPQRRSDPLKETTVNKIEKKLSKEVTIEPIKKLTAEVTIEPIKRTIKSDMRENNLKVSSVQLIKNELPTKEFEISNKSSEIPQTDTSYEGANTNETAKLSKNNLWFNKSRRDRMPMRSSIRIAKKKSIECLSESFTMKVNSKKGDQDCNKPECFSDKLKFMAMLQLRYLRNRIEMERFLREAPDIIPLGSEKR